MRMMQLDEGNAGIARKTAHAVFWNYTSFGLGKGLVFVTTAILARLLTPADFGLVGFATLAVNYLAILKDFGLGAALIQRQEDVERSADTVFSLNLALGILLSLVTFAVAPAIAAYFRQPQVVPLLRVLGLTFALNALGAVHDVRLQRQLAFRRKLMPDLGRSLVKGVVSIGLALLGAGVWALVWGQVAGTVAAVVLDWLAFPWLPRLRVHPGAARALLGFGVTLLGVNGLAIITDNLDYLIVGRRMGDVSLGIYTLAYRLPELLVFNILWVLATTMFPAFSRVQDRPDILRRGFLKTTRYVEIVAVPLCLGLILAADPLVRTAFGEQWLAAIPVVRVLGLLALVRTVGSNVGDVYKAIGRPDILFKLGLANALVMVIALFAGARYGLVGVAWGHVVAGLFRTVLRLAVARKLIDVRLGQIAAELMPAFWSGLALVALVLPALWLSASWPALWRLLLVAAAGAAGYLSVLWLFERESLLQMRQLMAKTG